MSSAPGWRAPGWRSFFPETADPTLTEAQLLDLLPGCVAAVAMPDDYSARVIEASAPPLKLIARSGVGYDSIDVQAAKGRGVWVTTTIGSNHDAVADYTLGLILDLARRITEINNKTKGGWWGRVAGMELRGKTLGIVGTGRIGREVAARAAPFGMRLVAYDLYPEDGLGRRGGGQYLPLPGLLEQADVVTLHAPSTAETRHLLNRETLAPAQARGVRGQHRPRGADRRRGPARRPAIRPGGRRGASTSSPASPHARPSAP